MLALLGGCPDRTVSEVTPEQGKVETKDIPAVPRKDVDILFVIDDSGSMKEEQESLRANFPRFIEILETIDGGLPNVQIGVITPNLGTSAIDGTTAAAVVGCSGQGQAGTLRELAPGGPRFLRDVADGAGGRVRNYGALTLADAFAQLATVGTTGCGIEQHLEAMKRALDGTNPANTGFVRDDAYLAVVVIADEDDCSLAKSTLFDAPNGETYGDVVNFRCTAQGVACETPATPFEDATGRREDCHPREDSTMLTSIARYVDAVRGLKRDPRDVVVAGIVGDPAPFEITKKGTTTVLKPSCEYTGPAGTQVAFPAVRTADFLSHFELNTRATICDGDLSDALAQIAATLKVVLVEPCFAEVLADADPATPGPQYDCSVVEVRRRVDGPDEQLRVIEACGGGATPCWRIEADPDKCGYVVAPHNKLVVDRGSEVPAPDVRVQASCVTASGEPPLR